MSSLMSLNFSCSLMRSSAAGAAREQRDSSQSGSGWRYTRGRAGASCPVPRTMVYTMLRVKRLRSTRSSLSAINFGSPRTSRMFLIDSNSLMVMSFLLNSHK